MLQQPNEIFEQEELTKLTSDFDMFRVRYKYHGSSYMI